MTPQDRDRLILALMHDKLYCKNCEHWPVITNNQQYGRCKMAIYCEDEGADVSLGMILSYNYCAAEKTGEPPIDHTLVGDTPRNYSCRLWKEK